MKPWIIAALICSACATYAAEDDNKIRPTCVEENNTRRCWVDHEPPTGVRPPQLQPVAPAPQAAIPLPAGDGALSTPAAMVAAAVDLPVWTLWANIPDAILPRRPVERRLTERTFKSYHCSAEHRGARHFPKTYMLRRAAGFRWLRK